MSPLETTYAPACNLVMIVGNYGSGKTEVAVNLALRLQSRKKKVSIADLDIVNPYFRCREARQLMQDAGIRVVIPSGAQVFSDLPIIVPEISGMLAPEGDDISIFDVGGDDIGARLLSSFFEGLGNKPYQLLQVLNSRRPFTDTVAGCLKMKEAIERSSRLRVSGLIANSHLVSETTVEIVREGFELALQVSALAGVPVEFVTAMGELAEHPMILSLRAPILRLERIMLPPWLRTDEKRDSAEKRQTSDPAPRSKPIGRP